jgi:hypothetical protein
MTWLTWLTIAVLIAAVAAITGLKPKGTKSPISLSPRVREALTQRPRPAPICASTPRIF